MTEKLYYTDAYMKEFDATVVSADGEKIVLDKTAFYPTGGGQLHDTGVLIADKEYVVVDVIKEGDAIVHILSEHGPALGTKVRGRIDWDRRYQHMRMHTSAHTFSQAIFRATGALCTGNQLAADQSRMDFSEPITKEQFVAFAEQANEMLAHDLPVTAKLLSKKEAKEIPGAFRLTGKDAPDFDQLRIVSIGDYDVEADGGTHVKSTKEVGKMFITKFENKGSKRKRIYWALDS